ncbi:hypothetical protein AXG93_2839s1190 [Marchantia polymorpha subsp. ruderalis]|uniref:Uncharacterized protein n=1 Tax=Marchantia polymorpha subsp. ruderalis TaxID=1480154 RepID=A0A176VEZ9_MARPO|nr:hypothetical protein AXG93_2839s1190 [Marchantia polymorpha subsp. ruderalis]
MTHVSPVDHQTGIFMRLHTTSHQLSLGSSINNAREVQSIPAIQSIVLGLNARGLRLLAPRGALRGTGPLHMGKRKRKGRAEREETWKANKMQEIRSYRWTWHAANVAQGVLRRGENVEDLQASYRRKYSRPHRGANSGWREGGTGHSRRQGLRVVAAWSSLTGGARVEGARWKLQKAPRFGEQPSVHQKSVEHWPPTQRVTLPALSSARLIINLDARQKPSAGPIKAMD